ncbi:MAG: hypothetical protein J6S24_06780, partial [Lentisphaeria bacterium]|nr:hypothetical protein [Lentisphaeria bacterium]
NNFCGHVAFCVSHFHRTQDDRAAKISLVWVKMPCFQPGMKRLGKSFFPGRVNYGVGFVFT